ncbi:MAG: transcription-repair coupling factor [Oscillospiraceae bacterium]|nr:transcription-repair coupling factor [Oscillospiraceae bacterium]
MIKILPIIQNSESFLQIALAANQNKASALFGAHPIHRAVYAAALSDYLKRPIIIITDTDSEATRLASDISVISDMKVACFPSRDFVFHTVEGTSYDLEHARLAVLGNILSGSLNIVTASLEAYCQHTIPAADYKTLSFHIETGDRLDIRELPRMLLNSGYTRSDKVDGRGQFALRGGIVDIFPANYENPVRVDFFGNEIESISYFDVTTQRSTVAIKSMDITPAREVILGDKQTILKILRTQLEQIDQLNQADNASNDSEVEDRIGGHIDDTYASVLTRDIEYTESDITLPTSDRYLPYCYSTKATIADYLDNPITIYCDPAALRTRTRTLIEHHWSDIEQYVASGVLRGGQNDFFRPFEFDTKDKAAIFTDVFARTGVATGLSEMININASTLPRFTGEFAPLLAEITGYLSSGFAVGIYVPTDRAATNIVKDLRDAGFSVNQGSDAELMHGSVTVSVGTLYSGFEIPSLKLVVFTGARATYVPTETNRRKKRDSFSDLEDLIEGDLIVHKYHGIGVFAGIHRIDHHGLIRDYIKIQYQGTDVLYLPVTQLDMITRYVSPKDDAKVVIAKLHSGEWQKLRKKIYRSAREMAKELIELYAQREQAKGIAFSADSEWQQEFEDRFIYEETTDQLRSAYEIKEDMQKEKPMDRLLCGDVGVGKTEVALRAAFKCVYDGYQCAVLVPTTILAWQHFGTFLERMENYPIKVVMLSRFSTPKEIREAREGIRNGTVDIAIGTHRLIQKDIEFRNLGLLVVDEEQRFGVGHKEKLKQKFPNIDVLTLSATPIPRTLNMAMSGLRDMSVIEYPPQDRHPVQTFVLEYDREVIRDAIEREVARGGQVFYLHNRILTIERTASSLRELCPDVRIEIAHGQMDEGELSTIWRRMFIGEVDVLCCTSIIETGVDVSNCNTLIVEDADRLGLAQLYQIRGRVGRSNRRAYAYFTFRKDSIITETASKRLSAIRDFTSFGSGFKIAMRDLQIRGAGGILSARQSGHMQEVGYDTYLDILNEAIDDEKGIKREKNIECQIDLIVDAYIPDSYISDIESRIEIYRRIAYLREKEDASDIMEELEDRFGEVPTCVGGLINVSLVRVSAGKLGIYEITQRDNRIYFYTDSIDPERVTRLIGSKSRKVMVAAKGKSNLSVDIHPGELPIDAATESIRVMMGKDISDPVASETASGYS